MINDLTKVIFVLIISVQISCDKPEDQTQKKVKYDTLKVTASAYNSVEAQTTSRNPSIAAWGDTLKAGMKAIAISRDFLEENILSHNSEVKIEGLEGTYIVKDKMNKRWTRKIDIYMGLDEEAARKWGLKEVEVYIPKKEKKETQEKEN